MVLDIQDDGGDATTSANVANQFVANKVTAVVHVSDIPTAASLQMDILNKAKVPVISFQSRDDYADTAKFPYAFGVLGSTQNLVDATAKWFAKHPEYKRLAVITDDIPSSKELLDDTVAALKKEAPDVTVVKQVSIPPGATDVSTALLELKGAYPDIVMPAVALGYGALWTGFHNLEWDPPIIGASYYDSYDSLKELADDGYTPSWDCVRENHPRSRRTSSTRWTPT